VGTYEAPATPEHFRIQRITFWAKDSSKSRINIIYFKK